MSWKLRKRALADIIFTGFALLSACIGLSLLGMILFQIFREGLAALSSDVFIRTTPAPGASGGLANALVGSVMMSALAMVAAIPLGMMAGVYLAEYDKTGRLSKTVRALNDIVLSAPSICFGLFVYEIAVLPFHGFSGYAGALSLMLIALPIILRTTEDMLTLVPDQMREAAAALGASTAHIVFSICFRLAQHGILTGILLAFARIVGETAPLLFTALNNQFWNLTMVGPTPNLPVTIYQLALSPYPDWHALAWAGAMIVTFVVLAINILARFLNDRAVSQEG